MHFTLFHSTLKSRRQSSKTNVIMSTKIFYILFIMSILFACAKEGFPPGGPEDKTPPEIVHTAPEQGATMVDHYSSVQVWFSERIEPRSAGDAIFITPYVGESVKYRIRGNRITLNFSEPLDSNRTYVATFGTGIKDYRNNAMSESFTLAFSTDSVLDEGEISGRVFGVEDARGIDVWAYSIKKGQNPDPSELEPDYIVQCSTNGKFTFSHISPGFYRLFAVRDRLADRLYQAVEDEVGVTFKDAILTREGSPAVDGFFFRMTRADTTGPSLVRVEAVDRHQLRLRFDEPVFSVNGFPLSAISVMSTEDSLDTLVVRAIHPDPLNSQVVHVLTQDQEDGKRYTVFAKHLWDRSGNPIDSAFGRTSFAGVATPDTISPLLVRIEPKPDDKSVDLNARIRLCFNEAIDSLRFGKTFSMGDTLGSVVVGMFDWQSPLEVIYVPNENLQSLTTYQVEIIGMNAADLAGNTMADTLFEFKTLNADTLSEIAGRIMDSDSTDKGEIHIIARQTGTDEIRYEQVIPDTGKYIIKNILPGQYLLECFRDRDKNGLYSYGKPFPYEPSERFVVYSDTIMVRSKWPNEGNDISIR